MAARKRRTPASARRRPPRRPPAPLALRITAVALLLFVAAPILTVAVYRFVPPPLTFLMVERMAEGRGLHKRWTPIDRISPALVRAVIAAEDARFCRHHGFDFAALRAAARADLRGGRLRGGSTISQQTAKNVFLWPHRDFVRKGLEAEFTVLIEAIWGKRRILEVYLNVVEWGPGVYGAEAAARRNFGEDAARITPVQADRMAAVLPDPLDWRAAAPGRFVTRRSRRIGAQARDDLAACVLRPG